MPSIYLLKDYNNLDPAHSAEEVSFTRFIIISYLFLSQQTPDLVYDLFAILKKQMSAKLEAQALFVYFSQLMLLLMSDTEDSAAKMIIFDYLRNSDPDSEISLRELVLFCSKYPLMFYSVERFRRHFRRAAFGDKFWTNRKFLKLKHKSLNLPDSRKRFLNEATTTVITSRSLICDVLLSGVGFDLKRKRFPLTDHIPSAEEQEEVVIDQAAAIKLKNVFGYKAAKMLIIDSLFPVASDLLFLNGYQRDRTTILTRIGSIHPSIQEQEEEEEEDGRLVIYDADHDRNFSYDCKSGDKAWALLLLSEDGECLDEMYY